MKRISIVTLLILALSPFLHAQKFQFGLQTGLNFSKPYIADKDQYAEGYKTYSFLPLFNMNAYLGFKSNSFWGLSVEPGYIQKGGIRYDLIVHSGDVLYAHQDVKHISNYIQVPILVDFYFTDKFFVSLGPEFDLHLSSKEESQDFYFDTSRDNAKLDVSVAISTNYNITENLDLRLLYNHSITSSTYFDWVNEFGIFVGRSKQYYQYIQLGLRLKTNWR